MNRTKTILLCASMAACAAVAGCSRRADRRKDASVDTDAPPRVTLDELFRSKEMIGYPCFVIASLDGHPGWEDAFSIGAGFDPTKGRCEKVVYVRLDETGCVHVLAESSYGTIGPGTREQENDLLFDLDGDGVEELLLQRISPSGGQPSVEIYRRAGEGTEICDVWNTWKAVWPGFDISIQPAPYSFGMVLMQFCGSRLEDVFPGQPSYCSYGHHECQSGQFGPSAGVCPAVAFHCVIKYKDAGKYEIGYGVPNPWLIETAPDRTVHVYGSTALFGHPLSYTPYHPPRGFFELAEPWGGKDASTQGIEP